MVTLGADCHKQSHTVVATDGNGRQLGTRTVRATPAGHLDALQWAKQWSERCWALEDCRHLSRRFEADLLSSDEAVVRVSPKMMAGARRSARTRGKSDPIDALAVARAAVREPDLPVAQPEGASRDVRLLVDHREDLVAERTRIVNRLRWHLHELAPGYELPIRSLNRTSSWTAVAELLDRQQGLVAELAAELLARIKELTARINELEQRITKMVGQLVPSLLELPGCGSLTAAKLLAETGDISRFHSRSSYARHNGTAPIPVWSGNRDRVRLNRGGNRQLNAAFHRVAVTQLRLDCQGRDYFARRLSAGDSRKAAFRVLRRRISDEVYRRLQLDLLPTQQEAHRHAA